MSNELFAYYFGNIKYHIQSGKGISIFNADDNLFFSFLTQVEATNRKRVVFKSSDYLKDGRLPNIDNTIDLVLIYQDVDIIDLQKFIDPFVNKLVYPAFYKNKSICFFSKNDADDYSRKQIKSGMIHTDLQKVFNFLFIEQLIDLIDQVNYKFSSPRFLKTSWEKTIYTPIEQIMKEALEKRNISFTPQVKLGRFYVDFLIECDNQKIIVECDGREYHNPYRDKKRDKELSKEDYRIIHFTGSEIYINIDSCIEKIQSISYRTTPKKYPIDEDLKKDESQLRTLDFITGLIRVLAPAGSGKTKTLINRIAQLLNKGIEPNSILALAFNKKAADEMKQRLKSKGIPVAEHFTRDEGVSVQTFHAFGYEIVRNKLNSRFDGHSVVKTTRKLLKRAIEEQHNIVFQRNKDSLDIYLEKLRKTKMELPHIEGVSIEENSKFIPFKNIFYSYLNYQIEHNFINFDDMIYMALRLLIDDKVLRKQLQNRFRYVLVDEFQDLNKAQLLMMQIIALPQNNLFIVGDDDQMIYGWRGAEVKYLREFNERYSKGIVKDCPLTTNYRSSKKIVKHSKWLISYNTRRIYKDINAKKDAKMGILEIELKETLWEQAKTVANWIKQLKERENIKWKNFAILFRYHSFQFPIAMALDSKNIPHSSVNGQRLFSSKVGKDLYSYFTVILRTDDACKNDYSRILNRPNKYFKNDIINKISDWNSFVKAEIQPNLSSWEREKLAGFIKTIKLLKRVVTFSTPPSSMLDKLNTELKLIDFYKDQSSQFTDLDKASDNVIFEVILALSYNFKNIDDFYEHMHKCLFNKDMSIRDYDEDSVKDNKIELSTIHAAKGKEFNTVVYFNLLVNEKLKKDTDVEEERRVSYVGITRAIDNIFITALKQKPSRFIKEIAFNPKIYSINELYSMLNKEKSGKAVIEYKIKRRNKKKELILKKYPELEGKNLVESYSFFYNIRMWLREKGMEKAAKRIKNIEGKIADLKDNYLIPILDSINEIETEINFRNILSGK